MSVRPSNRRTMATDRERRGSSGKEKGTDNLDGMKSQESPGRIRMERYVLRNTANAYIVWEKRENQQWGANHFRTKEM